MALQGNESAVTQFEVVFKEIDAIYDLPMRRLVGSPNSPKVALDVSMDGQLTGWHRYPQFIDEAGEKIDDATSDVPGMYGMLREYGYGPFYRSFSRKRSGPIDAKYVYVFSADSAEGAGLMLDHELYYEKGELSIVDLEGNSGKDVRKPGKKKYKSLWLDIVRVTNGKPAVRYYFAILAPFQIPWARLQELPKDTKTAARAQRIGDALFTDGFTDGDASKAKCFYDLFKGSKPDGLGFVLHLYDPMKEALLRVEPYHKWLDKWLDKQVQMSKDDEYVLGKRVEAYARAFKLDEIVAAKLPNYLRDAEADVFKLRLAVENYSENLMRWVSYGHQHEGGIIYRDGSGKQYAMAKAQAAPTAWFNPFTEAIRDYLGNADTIGPANDVAYAVQSRMAESHAGVVWMESVLDDLVAKKFPVSTAGAEMAFEAGRKLATAADSDKTWHKFFKHWAPMWTKKFRSDATKNMKSWLKATHDVDIETLSPAEFKREWRAMKKGRKNPGSLWIDSPKTKAGKATKVGLNHLMLGIETYNLAMSAMKLAEEPDGWNALGLVGSIGDFYDAASKVSKTLEEAKVSFKYAGATKVVKIAPFISIVSSVIDFILFGKEMLEAKTTGEKVGHGIRTFGAALTVVVSGAEVLEATGALTSEVGWGIPVFLTGILLEAGGSFAVTNLTPASVFLRHCKWGDPGNMLHRGLDKLDDGDFYGFKGKLPTLAGDIKAQHRVLNELIYDYDPKLELENEHSVIIAKSLILRTGTPEKSNPLNAHSRWKIDLTIDHNDGKPPDQWSFKPDELQSDEEATMNEPLVVKAFTKMKDADAHQRAEGVLHVRGTAKVDLFGDGKYVLEREIHKSFVMSW